VKKRNVLLLMLGLALLPQAGVAQDLPDLFSAVYEGVGEGLEMGAMQALAAMDQELTLELAPQSGRIEEGQTICLTITAGNPRPQQAEVELALQLPGRLAAAPDCQWEAVLPAAQLDGETGELIPSVTTFTREIALAPGGGSEKAAITAEMSMGTRFYRAQAELALCVPDVHVKAKTAGAEGSRVQPGAGFAYQLEMRNDGTADKDVRVELRLPGGVTAGAMPSGFAMKDGVISGQVRALAAGVQELSFPVTVNADALEGDEDALRLLSGTLHVDGERTALPRVEVCGARIHARLLPESESMEAGEEARLSVVVVNSGLDAADVELTCMLPEGLMLSDAQKAGELPTQSGEAANETPDQVPDSAPVLAASEQDGRTLVFDLHMEAARETADGVVANTQVIEIPVTAKAPQEKLSEYLMGATLAWRVDGEPAQLGEAVAMRVYRPQFLGVSKEEWSGIFWAGMLLMLAVCCLFAAARRDSRQEYLLYD